MRNTVPILALIQALSVACSAAAMGQVPEQARPCAVTGVGSVDSAWRQVRGAGFTFCVPGHWQARGHGKSGLDAKEWTGSDGLVRWSLGEPPTTALERHGEVRATVTEAAPGARGRRSSSQLQESETGPSCTRPATAPHLLGSTVLFITRVDCAGSWVITAWSANPRMYVQGEGHGEQAERLLLAVMQTVRFTAPTQ